MLILIPATLLIIIEVRNIIKDMRTYDINLNNNSALYISRVQEWAKSFIKHLK